MITMENFVTGVIAVSVATNLTTEVIKKLVGERQWNWNIVSCIVTLILAAGVSAGYIINTGATFTAQLIVPIVAFVYFSWLCAMLGYDKVREAFSQMKTPDE